MILILKFIFSAIQTKLSLRTVKIKEIIFELKKMKFIIRTSSSKSSKTKKLKINENQLKGSEANRVHKFTILTMEGPVNICIIRNRCLYARELLRFDQDKYVMHMDKVIVILHNRAYL